MITPAFDPTLLNYLAAAPLASTAGGLQAPDRASPFDEFHLIDVLRRVHFCVDQIRQQRRAHVFVRTDLESCLHLPSASGASGLCLHLRQCMSVDFVALGGLLNQHRFCPSVVLFARAAMAIQSRAELFVPENIGPLNRWVADLRTQARSPHFEKARSAHADRGDQEARNLAPVLYRRLKKHHTLTALLLECGYRQRFLHTQQMTPEQCGGVSISDAKRDFRKILKRVESESESVAWFSWRIAYSTRKGPYLQLLVLLPTRDVSLSTQFGQGICDAWIEKIVKSHGVAIQAALKRPLHDTNPTYGPYAFVYGQPGDIQDLVALAENFIEADTLVHFSAPGAGKTFGRSDMMEAQRRKRKANLRPSGWAKWTRQQGIPLLCDILPERRR
jgi:hypothetical protein